MQPYYMVEAPIAHSPGQISDFALFDCTAYLHGYNRDITRVSFMVVDHTNFFPPPVSSVSTESQTIRFNS